MNVLSVIQKLVDGQVIVCADSPGMLLKGEAIRRPPPAAAGAQAPQSGDYVPSAKCEAPKQLELPTDPKPAPKPMPKARKASKAALRKRFLHMSAQFMKLGTELETFGKSLNDVLGR